MDDNLKVDIIGLKSVLKTMGINSLKESRILGEVYFMLSLRCNLRCRVCAWWGVKGPCRHKNFLKKYAPVLKINDLMRFAEEILCFNPRRVTFSGGEPLFNNKWYRLAKFFKKSGVKVSLTTNGVFLFKEFGRIVDTVDEINLSLGGPPSILPIIRDNKPAHFKAIMKGLIRLTSFKKNNGNQPNLRILYTISGLSYRYMNELIKFMEDGGIGIDHYHFQHLMFIDKRTLNKQKFVFRREFGIEKYDLWRGYTFLPMELDFDLFRKEIQGLRKMDNVSFSPDLCPDELEPYYRFNRGALSYNKYCTAPWHQIDIMPNGDIYTCHDLFIGNLRRESFEHIWNGEASQKLRSRLTHKLFLGCKGCFYYYSERSR
jgi:MoaA/NifB/PqqE/SkfB family radical SAM enzyme